jgi:DNA-binding response OmpR family regulator
MKALVQNEAEPMLGLNRDTIEGMACQTILVAEDDPVCRHVLQKQLQDWGYRVLAVEDGEKAWQLLEQPGQSVSLLILDCLMPGVNGIELCRRIRQASQNSYQYILLLSGKDEKQYLVDGLNAGAPARPAS